MSNNTVTASNLRSYLRKLARGRKARTFTSDDAHRFYNRYGISESYDQVSMFNTVISSEDVESVGQTNSSRPARRGGQIRVWQFSS